ncbi:hypothetical protein ACQKJC_09050 [Priestia koreensis]|uniref:hypothetical protein n=1 Tax=Priestia koreensis TaxID=284581 RepID=UPI003CFCC7E5
MNSMCDVEFLSIVFTRLSLAFLVVSNFLLPHSLQLLTYSTLSIIFVRLSIVFTLVWLAFLV